MAQFHYTCILFCQAIINEDTQGNVRQLQAEVKKLKEQLAQALASPTADCGREVAPGGPALPLGNNMSNCLYLIITSSIHSLFFEQSMHIKIYYT